MKQLQSPQEAPITKGELTEWYMHPVAKKVRFQVQKELNQTRSRLADGFTLHESSADKTAIQTAKEVGYSQGLEFIFNIEGE